MYFVSDALTSRYSHSNNSLASMPIAFSLPPIFSILFHYIFNKERGDVLCYRSRGEALG